MMTERFRGKAITIICSDKTQSVHFYQDVLGAQPLPRENITCPWFRLGDITFNLMPNAAEKGDLKTPDMAGTMLWLEADDLEAAQLYFKMHDVPIVDSDETYLVIADPDGLLIEVWQSIPE